MRILPGVLKELAKHVPTVLFQSVEWNELAHELPKISRRMIKKEGYAELFEHHRNLLAPFDILLTTLPLSEKSIEGNRKFGEDILTLYFAQLHSPEGLFLDLRSLHFEPTSQETKWNPSSFWTRFDEDFRQGLLKVYEGFYLGKEALYQEGLASIGLIHADWDPEEKRKLSDLFGEQFGDASTEEMAFSLDHLNQTIVRLSDFTLKKKMKIPTDFLYLGICLVSLYSTLEETTESFPVKDIYLEVRKHFSSGAGIH